MDERIGAPWSLDADGVIVDNTGLPIMRPDLSKEERAIRSRLIGAAPRMFEACESISLLADPALYSAPRETRNNYVIFFHSVARAVAEARGLTVEAILQAWDSEAAHRVGLRFQKDDAVAAREGRWPRFQRDYELANGAIATIWLSEQTSRFHICLVLNDATAVEEPEEGFATWDEAEGWMRAEADKEL